MVGFVEGFKKFVGDFLRDNDPRFVVDVCKDILKEFKYYTLWGKFLGSLVLIVLPLLVCYMALLYLAVFPLIIIGYVVGWSVWKVCHTIANKYNFRLKVYKDEE